MEGHFFNVASKGRSKGGHPGSEPASVNPNSALPTLDLKQPVHLFPSVVTRPQLRQNKSAPYRHFKSGWPRSFPRVKTVYLITAGTLGRVFAGTARMGGGGFGARRYGAGEECRRLWSDAGAEDQLLQGRERCQKKGTASGRRASILPRGEPPITGRLAGESQPGGNATSPADG